MDGRSAKRSRERHDGLMDALVQAAFATMAVLNEVGADHDLSLTQLRVLAILRDRRLRMAALATYLGLERSTMTGLVDRAEARGLLARAPAADDGRAVEVFLAPQGRALADRLYTHVNDALAPMTDVLDPPERRRLQRSLERMLARVRERLAGGHRRDGAGQGPPRRREA